MSEYRWGGLAPAGGAVAAFAGVLFVAANSANGPNVVWDPWTALAAVVAAIGVALVPAPGWLQERERRRQAESAKERMRCAPRIALLPQFINEGCGILEAAATAGQTPTFETLAGKWWGKVLAHFGEWGIRDSVPVFLASPSSELREDVMAFLHPRVDFLNRTLCDLRAEFDDGS